MELNRFKLPKGTNNFLIWALVAVIVLGFESHLYSWVKLL